MHFLAIRIINTSRGEVRKSITDSGILLFLSLFHSLFWPGFKSPAAKSEWKCNLECSAAWNSMHWPWARSSDKCQFAFDLQMFFFWLPLIAPPPLQSPILSAQLPNTPAPTVPNHWNRNR